MRDVATYKKLFRQVQLIATITFDRSNETDTFKTLVDRPAWMAISSGQRATWDNVSVIHCQTNGLAAALGIKVKCHTDLQNVKTWKLPWIFSVACFYMCALKSQSLSLPASWIDFSNDVFHLGSLKPESRLDEFGITIYLEVRPTHGISNTFRLYIIPSLNPMCKITFPSLLWHL
jgi:hypothetical protein